MRELALRLCGLLVAGDQYRHALAATLRVSVPEVATLGHLFHAGHLTPTAIAERLGVTTASVTGLLDRLAAAGYVTRSPNPRDRRSVLVTLTDDGRSAIEAAFDLVTSDVEAAVAGSEPAERAGLERLLHRTTEALRQRAADPDQLAELLAAGREDAPPADTRDRRENSAP